MNMIFKLFFSPSLKASCLLNFIYTYRKRYENVIALALYYLLLLADNNNYVHEHILHQNPPCYLYAKYLDWIRPYLESYVEAASKQSAYYAASLNREELGKRALQTLASVEAKAFQRIEDVNGNQNKGFFEYEEKKAELIELEIPNNEEKKVDLKENEDSQNILTSLYSPLLIGKTVDEAKIYEEVLWEQPEDMSVLLQVYESKVYYSDSKPTRYRNLSIPKEIMSGESYFSLKDVHPDSSIICFVHDNRLKLNENDQKNQINTAGNQGGSKKVNFCDKTHYEEAEPNMLLAPLGSDPIPIGEEKNPSNNEYMNTISFDTSVPQIEGKKRLIILFFIY
jgi:hypothetical protein